MSPKEPACRFLLLKTAVGAGPLTRDQHDGGGVFGPRRQNWPVQDLSWSVAVGLPCRSAACGGKKVTRAELRKVRLHSNISRLLLNVRSGVRQASRSADLTRILHREIDCRLLVSRYQKMSAWRFTRSPCCRIACNFAFDGARQSSRRARSCSSSRRSPGAANATLTCSFARQNR